MSTLGPGEEMQRRIVNLLRADAILSDTTTGLLYPEYAPHGDNEDLRVFGSDPTLPNDTSTAVSQLPRVLVEVMTYAHPHEQDDPAVLHGPVKVWVHTVVNLNDEQLGATIDARITTILLSTWLSDARIIAPRLALDGMRRRERIGEFNGAWEYVSGFAAGDAGSLQ